MRIAFIGAGRWAFTLAILLYRKKKEVILWEPREEIDIDEHKRKLLLDFPPDTEFPEDLNVTKNLEEVMAHSEIIFFAVPAQVLRNVLVKMSKFKTTFYNNRSILVSAIKGLENTTNKRMSEILNEFFTGCKIVVLGGPGIPYEIVSNVPTALVVASNDLEAAEAIQNILSSDTIRIYTQNDVVGTELGGALKNIYAIAGGICDGLKLGANAKAAVLTRGLYEMIRLGVAFNANPMTFAGLAGVGDLIVTAYSEYSRNRRLGEKIGLGMKLEEIINQSIGVIEGLTTVLSVYRLANKLRIEVPIAEAMYEIIYKRAEIDRIVKKLMARPLKYEVK
ncbi:MAG: NAD(P)-dependent glycerol-3-phosphate dehydrogenase [candidate division WOR-3 bacterium]|nr:NAD(P)-dependent glycerol-3-phosphate dehydrogenase [candidate division WOR-3 bacterium]MCX7757355.1 NAD(P)-dependent glycerol-3-phosphate dehydrogenase [candidate division WOR-3 bacterium]MDW7987481.1 NAD(P)H-dependent glycerol-3-phosphate dehydrogenase [candidate division WOR-3 bacterium]